MILPDLPHIEMVFNCHINGSKQQTKAFDPCIALILFIVLTIMQTSANATFAPQDTISKERVISLTYETVKRGPFQYQTIVHPKLGIALSGGGLRGFAQVGVLEELEKAGIDIDYIAGSSMGAMVGGLYAIGCSPEELIEFALKTDWANIFKNTPELSTMFVGQRGDINKYLLTLRFQNFMPYIPQAITQGQRLFSLLNTMVLRTGYLHVAKFDEFRIPLRVISTNNITGKQKVFTEGNLALIIFSSIAAPFIINEVTINDTTYVDGGLINNIPTDVAQSMGSDIIIAIDCTSPLYPLSQLKLPNESIDRYSTIMQAEKNEQSRKLADVVIAPELGISPPYDYNAIPEFVELGRQKARELIPIIREKLASVERTVYDSTTVTIEMITITGNRTIPAEFIKQYITTIPHLPTSEKRIAGDLKAIFTTGYFADVKAVLKRHSEGIELEYSVKENPVITSINVSGTTVFHPDTLKDLYCPGINNVFNTKNGETFLRDVFETYNRLGYSIAYVKTFSIDTTAQTLNIVIDEGRIGGIQLLGNKKTQPHVLRRELSFNSGDIFEISKVKRGIDNIYGTGLFQRVYPTFSQERDRLILQINVEEKRYDVIGLGAQFDVDQQAKGFIELADDNFGGLGMKSIIHARYGAREEDYRYKFRLDRIFDSYLTVNGDVHYTSKKLYLTDQFNDFSLRGDVRDTRIGGSLSVGEQLRRFGMVSVRLMLDKAKVEAYPFSSLSQSAQEYFLEKVNEQVDIRTICIQSVVDTRDKQPFPNYGYFQEIYYENASSLLGSKLAYIKFYASLGYAYTLNKIHTFEPRVFLGFSDETLPYSQRFRWGGLQTFLGKRQDSMHGRMIVASNVGYRLKLPLENMFDTYVSVRWDLASLVEKNQKVSFNDFRHALGAIISMNTPIGPIEFGYGMVFNSGDRVYFSLGQRF